MQSLQSAVRLTQGFLPLGHEHLAEEASKLDERLSRLLHSDSLLTTSVMTRPNTIWRKLISTACFYDLIISSANFIKEEDENLSQRGLYS